MNRRTALVLLACTVLPGARCYARSHKTKLYRNARWNFCAYVPADWRRPSRSPNDTGAGFVAPDDQAAITLGALPNQPRSTILQQSDAGSQMASLDDYRGVTLKEWEKDASLTDIKQQVEELVTFQQVPALHTVLTYTRDGVARRHDAILALWNQTQYAVEYDTTMASARRYRKSFLEVIRTYQFNCTANEER